MFKETHVLLLLTKSSPALQWHLLLMLHQLFVEHNKKCSCQCCRLYSEISHAEVSSFKEVRKLFKAKNNMLIFLSRKLNYQFMMKLVYFPLAAMDLAKVVVAVVVVVVISVLRGLDQATDQAVCLECHKPMTNMQI